MNYKQVMGKGSKRISDSGIDKWHDFTDNDRQLCESNTQGIYYVIARDKFMSGWGGAEGRTSYFVEVCWSSTQANYAEEAISQAREMRNVRVVSKLPTRLNGHVSVYNFDHSARFNKEYFWNISKGYEKDNDIVPHDSDKTQKTNVSDSRKRVKDNAGDVKWIANVEVDVRMEDENGVYSSENFRSKSTGRDYTWEEMIDDDDLHLYSELCDTEDEAWDCAMDLLWSLVNKGYTEDGFTFNIEKVEVDENGDIVDYIDYGDTYNAWYNEHTNQINYA